MAKQRGWKVLYITYYGALKHLCHTQVIPYLRELRKDGIEVTLLSFEERQGTPEEERAQIAALREQLTAAGIDWHWRRYHKRPSLPATAYDVFVGCITTAWLVLRKRIDVIHVRSHVPAAMGLVVAKLLRRKLVFDFRGLLAEEYVDAGTWKPNSLTFHITKWFERRTFRRADAIIMLTDRIKRILTATPELQQNPCPIEVIPCCVQLEQYRDLDPSTVRRQLGLESRQVMAYVGSLGGWYMAEPMVALFAEALHLDARAHFLVLTQSPHEMITKPLREAGIPGDSYTLRTVAPSDLPAYLSAADFAISFIKPCFSKTASSPTKLGEYLGSGLPIVCNSGIGDVDELIESEKVGVLVREFTPAAYRAALAEIMTLLRQPGMRAHCREVAERRLSMDSVGGERYRRLYRRLAADPDVPPAGEASQ